MIPIFAVALPVVVLFCGLSLDVGLLEYKRLQMQNAADAGVQVRFEQGNAAALPLKDASIDFVVCRAAFKNFSEPQKALMEMRRVLRPSGKALVIDMRRDASLADLKQYTNELKGLNRWFVLSVFRFVLIKRAYPVQEFRRMVLDAGWKEPQINTSTTGFEALMTK